MVPRGKPRASGDRAPKIPSFGVEEPEAAKVCYEAGASLYFGSPAEMVGLAVGETVILLHPPLHLAGVSIVMGRERQQNDSLVNG